MQTHPAELISACKQYVNAMVMIDSFLESTSQLQYPVKFGSMFFFFFNFALSHTAHGDLDGFELLSSCFNFPPAGL